LQQHLLALNKTDKEMTAVDSKVDPNICVDALELVLGTYFVLTRTKVRRENCERDGKKLA
jgi:hypothetical protein